MTLEFCTGIIVGLVVLGIGYFLYEVKRTPRLDENENPIEEK